LTIVKETDLAHESQIEISNPADNSTSQPVIASFQHRSQRAVHGSIDYDSLSLNFSAKERKDQRNEKHPSSTPKGIN